MFILLYYKIIGIKHKKIQSVKGKSIFQDIIISMSQRNRQYVIRIHVKKKDKSMDTVIITKILIGIAHMKKM